MRREKLGGGEQGKKERGWGWEDIILSY